MHVFGIDFNFPIFFTLKTRCLLMASKPNLSRPACARLANPILYKLIFASRILACVFELLNLVCATQGVGVQGSLDKYVLSRVRNLPDLFLTIFSFYFCLVSRALPCTAHIITTRSIHFSFSS